MGGDPIYLEYPMANGEERYKVLGATGAGVTLIANMDAARGQGPAVTAYRAGRAHQERYWRTRA